MKHPFNLDDLTVATKGYEWSHNMDTSVQALWDSAVARGAITEVPYPGFASLPPQHVIIKLPEDKT